MKHIFVILFITICSNCFSQLSISIPTDTFETSFEDKLKLFIPVEFQRMKTDERFVLKNVHRIVVSPSILPFYKETICLTVRCSPHNLHFYALDNDTSHLPWYFGLYSEYWAAYSKNPFILKARFYPWDWLWFKKSKKDIVFRKGIRKQIFEACIFLDTLTSDFKKGTYEFVLTYSIEDSINGNNCILSNPFFVTLK